MYRSWYAEAEPYTEAELRAIPFDGDIDYSRYRAFRAVEELTFENIPLVADDD